VLVYYHDNTLTQWNRMKPHRLNESSAAQNNEDELYEALALIKTSEEAALFLQDLCTPTELQSLADRWRVVAEIKSNKSYRQIYQETGVSVATIGRVARSLLLGKGGYQLIFKRIQKKKNNSKKPMNK